MTRETDPAIVAEQRKQLEDNPDFILLRRYEYSIEKALIKNPNGLPDNSIAQALGKPEKWVKRRYTVIIEKLRAKVVI